MNFGTHVHIMISNSYKNSISNSYIEKFLRFNLCSCNKEFVENHLFLEKY
jgi:hypothetical protein